jgi:hypothetical protein
LHRSALNATDSVPRTPVLHRSAHNATHPTYNASA